MEWRKITTSPWVGLAGVISLVWGIPGMGEDAGVWQEWVGTMNSGWHWLATGVGATLVILWLTANGPSYLKKLLRTILMKLGFRPQVTLTKAEFDALKEAGKLEPNTTYMTYGKKDG